MVGIMSRATNLFRIHSAFERLFEGRVSLIKRNDILYLMEFF